MFHLSKDYRGSYISVIQPWFYFFPKEGRKFLQFCIESRKDFLFDKSCVNFFVFEVTSELLRL